ncbi:MAG: helix-turn-helix domain-containing protein [Flavobacteriales bacterium]|nr:helix-turn-helix domain-containing protein [Flavobacteriales bacterium]
MGQVRDEAYLQRFGFHVRKLRTEKQLSQYQLADLSNVSRSQIMGIENGTINPTLCTLKAVAEGLSISLTELVEVA